MANPSYHLPNGTVLNSGQYSYRIVKTLGSGGFGITYLAVSRRTFGNISVDINFAIKEHFLSEYCERDHNTLRIITGPGKQRETVNNSLKDFIGEARRLQRICQLHKSIVKVNEVFELNGTAYYVMEYLKGETLRSYVDRRNYPLTEAETNQMLQPISEAMDILHHNRITHLDIKPDNIMLEESENGDGVKIMSPTLIDFGLSKHYDERGNATSTINTQGCSNGYAPIEQYAGITKFSPAADIYALAATHVFCLTKQDPPQSQMLVTDSQIDELLGAVSEKVSPMKKSLLRAALSANPALRPFSMSATQVFQEMNVVGKHPVAPIQNDPNRTVPLQPKSHPQPQSPQPQSPQPQSPQPPFPQPKSPQQQYPQPQYPQPQYPQPRYPQSQYPQPSVGNVSPGYPPVPPTPQMQPIASEPESSNKSFLTPLVIIIGVLVVGVVIIGAMMSSDSNDSRSDLATESRYNTEDVEQETELSEEISNTVNEEAQLQTSPQPAASLPGVLAEKYRKEAEIELVRKALNEGYDYDSNGLVYKILDYGRDVFLDPTDKISIAYEAKSLDGRIFAEASERSPYTVRVKGLLHGNSLAVQKIGYGGHIIVIIPYDLAYGAKGLNGIVQPNEAVKFDIRVLPSIPD